MAIDDRDYYLDRLRARDGYIERSAMRVSLGRGLVSPPVRQNVFPLPVRRNVVSHGSPGWHWSLTVIATVAICLVVWGVLRVFAGLR